MPQPHQYRFGDFCLDTSERGLFREGKLIALTPKALETLIFLVERHGHIVEKKELMDAMWPGTYVEEGSLARNVSVLRKTLSENQDGQAYIETIPKRGYRFVAEVQLGPETAPSRQAAPVHPPETAKNPRTFPWKLTAVLVSVVAVIVILGSAFLYFRHRPVLTERDTIVVADFSNTTGDNVFDDTLRQALTVELEQSPFLNVLSHAQVSEQLKLMRHAPDERLTEPLARELCQRSASVALIAGYVRKLGTQYVIGLNVENCQTGGSLGSAQAAAANREKVLSAVAEASARIRAKLGESLASIRKFDTPVEQATTNSLEALKAYSRAVQTPPGPDVVPLLKLAIELDPNFAAAYSALGVVYTDLGEYEAANECYRKAYELRERLTEREKLHAIADYYSGVIGDLDRANGTYEIWQQAYPRDAIAHNDLAYNLELVGQYERELLESLTANRIDPSLPAAYVHLMFSYTALNRPDDAVGAYKEAQRHHLDDYPDIHYMMYQLASIDDDTTEMEHQLAWSKGKAEVEGWMLSFSADVQAFSGHLQRARELSGLAVESVGKTGQRESCALIRLNRAWRDSVFGYPQQGRKEAESALKQMPSRDVQSFAALVLASAGDNARAQAIADELGRRYVDNTLLNTYWLPAIRAVIEINHKNPGKALVLLQPARRAELGIPEPSFEEAAPFLPVYIRGQAYLLLGRGKESAAEFQRLIDYRGVTTNSPLAAVAHLKLGDAYVLQGDTVRARSEYEKFLNLWKDADSDIPMLKKAKAEFAKLQ
jgi:DNA-binding winged helix-turn-helix (wHTH) protein/tetratricopeptide (TPR) repeat protein